MPQITSIYTGKDTMEVFRGGELLGSIKKAPIPMTVGYHKQPHSWEVVGGSKIRYPSSTQAIDVIGKSAPPHYFKELPEQAKLRLRKGESLGGGYILKDNLAASLASTSVQKPGKEFSAKIKYKYYQAFMTWGFDGTLEGLKKTIIKEYEDLEKASRSATRVMGFRSNGGEDDDAPMIAWGWMSRVITKV